MCTVINGFYQIDYEVGNGRKCVPGDAKDILVGFTNHTGSLKYVIDLMCQSTDQFIHLSHNGTGPLKIVQDRVLLPPAYRKRGSIQFQRCELSWNFVANISLQAQRTFKTVLKCSATVEARANVNDPDAIKVVSNHPKIYSFFPPLESP